MNKHPVDVLLSFLIQADSPGPLTQYLYAVCLKVKWLFGKENKTLGLWWPPVVKQPILLFPVGKTKQVERVRMEKIWARERRYMGVFGLSFEIVWEKWSGGFPDWVQEIWNFPTGFGYAVGSNFWRTFWSKKVRKHVKRSRDYAVKTRSSAIVETWGSNEEFKK